MDRNWIPFKKIDTLNSEGYDFGQDSIIAMLANLLFHKGW